MATRCSTVAWKNSLDGGAWWATGNGIAKDRTLLSNFTSSIGFDLEDESGVVSCNKSGRPNNDIYFWCLIGEEVECMVP